MRLGSQGPALTTVRDARFTRVGRILAQLKLDELPQLWHVLCGEMSLVGPRPEDPVFVAQFPDEYMREILRTRPGITGLTQLAFAAESRVLDPVAPLRHYRDVLLPQKVALDQLYVSQRTFWLDLRILFWTGVALLLRRAVAVHRRTARLTLRRRPQVSLAVATEIAPGA